MREMVKMVITLTVLAAFSGGLLSAVKGATAERIEQAVLEFVQGPAILSIMTEVSNDPWQDRFSIEVERSKKETSLSGRSTVCPKYIAFEQRRPDTAANSA
jgi:Na+-translocating ferredoxin:NAD+ oxidoreductase RnfG subunit